MKPKPISRTRVAAHLANALDAVTAALIVVGSLPTDPTDDALDEVLRIHRGVLQARRTFRKSLDALLARVRDEGVRQGVLALEESANAVAWNSADAGYRLGILNGWASGRAEGDEARKRPSRLRGKLPGKAEK